MTKAMRSIKFRLPLAPPALPGYPTSSMEEHVYKYSSSKDSIGTLVLRQRNVEDSVIKVVRFLASNCSGEHHGRWWEDESQGMLFVKFNSHLPNETDLQMIELRSARPLGCWVGHDDTGALVHLQHLQSACFFIEPPLSWRQLGPL